MQLASFRFFALLGVASPALFGACGGDDDSGGKTNTGGKTSAGGTTGTAGKTSAGGTTGTAGKSGTGGGPACEINECLRANVCLDKCGGKVVYTGCCACEAPTVDELSCK